MENNLVLKNANIITMNPGRPRARAVAVRQGRIVAVGTEEDIRPFENGPPAINLNGKTVLPGLIDSHVHFTATGIKAMAIDFSIAGSISQVQTIIAEAVRAAGKGRLLYGMGINHYKMPGQHLPGLHDLDHAAPDHPLFIVGATGHNSLVNTRCLEILNLPEQVLDFYADGCLRGNAHTAAVHTMRSRIVMEQGLETFQKKAAEMALAKGLTTVHALEGEDRPDDPNVASLTRLAPGLELQIVTWYQTLDIEAPKKLGLPRIGGCILLDGDFGPHTAAMLEPYNDRPDNRGLLYYSQAEIDAFVERAHRAGMQIAMHAVGDRAAEQALNAYEKALAKWPKKDHRHRIEHFEIYDQALVERVLQSGVHLGIQPPFNYHFGGHQRLDNLLGPQRALRSDPLGSLIDAGLPAGGGSDSYVTPMDPLYSIHCAANHSIPTERLDAERAIQLYTIDNAHLSFEEKDKGSVEEGKLGDFTVVDSDPTRVPIETIQDISVAMTIIQGAVVYSQFHIQ